MSNRASNPSRYCIVIPARYASTRLPGKPLADIAGKPMIQRVYERASKSAAAEIIVATDDQRVFDVVEGFGGRVVMTSSEHPSGTDRLCEVAQSCNFAAQDIVVNLQGDEPEMPVAVLEQVAANLEHNPLADIATLCTPINDIDELLDTNAVKVVRDVQDFALYFSRAAIPHLRGANPDALAALREQFENTGGDVNAGYYRHLGLYAYRVRALQAFVSWPVSPLEASEKLEQLRALSNGLRIHCAEAVAQVPPGIDCPEDLERARKNIAAAN